MYLLLADLPTQGMTPTAWWIFALVCGFIWGGFGLLLLRAIRREGRKR